MIKRDRRFKQVSINPVDGKPTHANSQVLLKVDQLTIADDSLSIADDYFLIADDLLLIIDDHLLIKVD